MILPLMLGALLGCRTTMSPPVPVPRDNPSEAWEAVLSAVVDADGYVDYEALEANRRPLDQYVAWVGRKRAIPGRGGASSHAFWINTYNALTLYQVLERGRPASVLDVKGWPRAGWGFFFWTDFRIDGNLKMSLWEIGHERVIEVQQDYRDFAVLTLAARSSPPLRPRLYTPDRLDKQLDEAFSTWMNSDRGVRIADDRALFNPIFRRYGYEVGLFTHHTDLCTLAAKHATGAKKAALAALADDGCPHDFFAFDWRLNQAGAPGEGRRKGRKGRKDER